MAGDWIKLETATIDKPEVIKLARLLGIPKTQAVGCLVVFWAWIDANSVDGGVDGVVDADVDALVDAPGFANALRSVGWLEIDNGCEKIRAPHFERHNGKTAKNRALKTERQKNWRKKSVDGGASTLASTREEKRREDIKEKTSLTRSPKEKPQRTQKTQEPKPPPWHLPPQVDSAAWQDFEQHRAAMKIPLTDQARTKNANLLAKYPTIDQRTIVDNAIRHGWRGLYEPRKSGNGQDRETSAQRFMRMLKDA